MGSGIDMLVPTASASSAWRGVACFVFFFQAEDGIRDLTVTGVQTCALPISDTSHRLDRSRSRSIDPFKPLSRKLVGFCFTTSRPHNAWVMLADTSPNEL